MRHRLAVFLVPIVVAAFLTPACGGGGGSDPGGQDPGGEAPPPEQLVRRLEPGQGVRVMQVDFELDLNSVTNSTWGRVQLDPEVIAAHLGEEGGYVNVATEGGWAVVNMPVPPPTEPPLVTYFHLDAEEGDPLELVAVRVQHSRYPIADITEWADDLAAFEVEDWLSAKGGVTNEPTEDPGLPPLSVPVGTAVPVGQETYTFFQPVTNVQCAESQCFPMAVANCLQFLEDGVHLAVPYAHVLGLRGDNTLVGVLDGDFYRFVQSRSVGDGSSFIEAVDGTFKWLRESLQETSLTYRHQDRGWGTVGVDSLPGGNYTKDGVTSVDDGALVSANWLEQRVRDGCAVVAVYHESTGGHAVRVTGFGRIGGIPWVRYSHDDVQTSWDPTDTKGLENVWFMLADSDGDGQLNMGSQSRELDFAWALCP